MSNTQHNVAKAINALAIPLPFEISANEIQVKENFILIADSGRFNNYINGLLVSNSPAKESIDTIYQYRNFERSIDLLLDKCFSFSVLANFCKNEQDMKEYEHFYDLTTTQPQREFILEQKRNHFISCLTDKRDDKRFWDEYTNNGKGICIEFAIRNKHFDGLFDFRDVCYDDGTKFKIISDLQKNVYKEVGKYVLIEKHSKFASFYKRANYDWECEKRLFIDLTGIKENLPKGFILNRINDEIQVLKVPFINKYFEAKIISIRFGYGLKTYQKTKLFEIINQNYGCSSVELIDETCR